MFKDHEAHCPTTTSFGLLIFLLPIDHLSHPRCFVFVKHFCPTSLHPLGLQGGHKNQQKRKKTKKPSTTIREQPVASSPPLRVLRSSATKHPLPPPPLAAASQTPRPPHFPSLFSFRQHLAATSPAVHCRHHHGKQLSATTKTNCRGHRHPTAMTTETPLPPPRNPTATATTTVHRHPQTKPTAAIFWLAVRRRQPLAAGKAPTSATKLPGAATI